MFLTQRAAAKQVGKLAKTSKMPCDSWGIPARACKTGAKLRKIKGSVCEKCYGSKGHYVMATVDAAYTARLRHYNRLAKEGSAHIWREAMVTLIRAQSKRRKVDVFRWFDCGDLQGVEMLENIVKVCKATPDIDHWLPTKERGMLDQYLDKHKEGFPVNLWVRLSASMVDGNISGLFSKKYFGDVFGAFVHTEKQRKGAIVCQAYTRGGECGECRACWDCSQVSYPLH